MAQLSHGGVGHLVGLKMPGEYKEEWKKWSLNAGLQR